ncbi:MarR family transcriptional regulator, partial [Streptococcus pneumoniae]
MDFLLYYDSKKKGDTMTYLEKWFDFNRRQKEIESLLEET